MADVTTIDETISLFADIYKDCGTPVALLDNYFQCLWTNDDAVLAVGQMLTSYARGVILSPLTKLTEVRFFRDDHYYCARITPVKAHNICICEFIDSAAAISIAEKTDISGTTIPVYSALETATAAIWKNGAELRSALLDKKDFASLEKVMDIGAALAQMSSLTQNIFEYLRMTFGESDSTVTDAGTLCRALEKRCNAALAKCGRRIEVVVEPESLFIRADGRNAVTALVKAVQNALLYSPRDSVPYLAVFSKKDGERLYVCFRLTNESIMFTKKDFSDKTEVNFSYQRTGFGIPIIRRFAEMYGGSLDISDNGGKYVVTVTLPAAPDNYDSFVKLSSAETGVYKTGIPDFTEIKMREVAALFGETE